MRYQNNHQEWNKIKQALKEKYTAPSSVHHAEEDKNLTSPDVYWSHMSRITGRTKEDIQKRFKNL
jgi:hypothetical protein